MFLGPPYNSMPLADVIDYPSAGLTFNITNTTTWLPEPVPWATASDGPAQNHRGPSWWLPDANVSGVAIPVRPRLLAGYL